MKKFMLYFIVFASLILAFLYVKNREKPIPVVPVVPKTQNHVASKFILTYSSVGKGAIEGVSPQQVERGGDGSPVTAVPSEHYHFTGWSDGVTTASRTDRKIAADLTVTANFAVDQLTVEYNASEGGVISGDGSQKVGYGGSGTKVKAVPAPGYHFSGWSDGVSTPDRVDSELTDGLTVTANFIINQYTLTYIAAENGTIDGASPQSITHGGDGSPVTAVPAEHYHFTGWSDGVRTAGRVDRKVTSDLAVTADFAIDKFTRAYIAAEHGSISGADKQTVEYGSDGAVVTAVPAPGYHFERWSDGVLTPERIDNKATADLTVTAVFAVNRYNLTYTAGKNGSISGAGSQTVEYGSDASAVTAVANKGYHFVAWSDGITTARRVDLKVMADLKVGAVFAVDTFAVGGSVSGLAEGTRLRLRNNGGDNLEVIAEGAFRFKTELPFGSTYRVEVLSQPTAPNQTCTVTGGKGVISDADVTDVAVTCVPVTYRIGGKVSGLTAGDRVEVQNNGGDNLLIGENGPFVFEVPLDDGSAYSVTVYRQPSRRNWTCKAENATGNLEGRDVTGIVIDCFPKVVPQVIAGKKKIKLNWNSQDFSGVTFNLCFAPEEFADGGEGNCQSLKGGVFKAKVTAPLVIPQLIQDISYWFQLEARYTDGRRTLSEAVVGTPFGGLNDSGVDWCTDYNHDRTGTRAERMKRCEDLATSFPGQDAVYGRDAAAFARKLTKIGSGSAGFDFTKMCRNGEVAGEGKCPPNPVPGSGKNNWACTRDNTTGLLWEVKTASGLRGKDNTYTWFKQDASVNGGADGLKNGGRCEGSDCDTKSYVEAVNASGLCGVSDWRIPTKRELLSIVDNARFNPAIDKRYFPNTQSSHYWSSLPSADQDNSAWQVYFRFGEASPDKKSQGNLVRLVHGRTVTFGRENP